jgi:hypothetical protein
MRENGNYNISQQERKANFVYEMKISDFSKLAISLQSFLNVFHSMWFVHAQMYISNSILHIQLSLLIQKYHGFMSVEYHQSSYVNLLLLSTNKISFSVTNVHVNSRACKALTCIYNVQSCLLGYTAV